MFNFNHVTISVDNLEDTLSFYKNSRDYVTVEKQNTFMNPNEVAKIICDNIFNDLNLNVADIIIERN